jgi:hypothetical protein
MNKSTETAIKYTALGFFGLLFVKYVVLGLDDWNNTFHPERTESNTMPVFFRQGLIISTLDELNNDRYIK